MAGNKNVTKIKKGPFATKFVMTAVLGTMLSTTIPLVGGDMSLAAYPPDSEGITGPVVVSTGETNYSEDTTIMLKNLSHASGTAVLTAENGGKVTIGADHTLTAIVKGGNYSLSPGLFGIEAKKAGIVDLKGAAVVTSYNATLLANSGGKITVGNNSQLYGLGLHVGSAAVAYGSGSEINIGNNSTMVGTIFGSESGVVSASAGGVVNIGTGANIFNDATSGTTDLYGNKTIGDTYAYHMAVNVVGGGTVNIGADSTIEVKALNNALGITGQVANVVVLAGQSSSINNKAILNIGAGANIIGTGDEVIGVYSSNFGEITIGDGSKITTDGIKSQGVNTNAGTIVMGKNIEVITKQNNNSHGIAATQRRYEDGKYVAGSITVGDNLTVTTNGTSSLGISASAYGAVYIGDGAKINTYGTSSHGVYAQQYGVVDIGDRLVINTYGTGSGVRTNYVATINVGDYAEINIHNESTSSAYGVASFVANSKITIGDNAKVKTVKDHVVVASAGKVEIGDSAQLSSGGGRGVYATDAGLITVGDDATIATKGNYAVVTNGGATTEIGMRANISTTGAPSIIADGVDSKLTVGSGSKIRTVDSDAVVGAKGGNVILKGADISGGENGRAIYAYGDLDSSSGFDVTRIGQVSGEGKFTIDGSIVSDDYSKIVLKMSEESYFKGYTEMSDTEAELNILMDNTLWNITADSNLNNLHLQGTKSSVLDFRVEGGTSLTNLEINNLSTAGVATATFVMRANMADQTSDKIIVNDTCENLCEYKIYVIDQNTGGVVTGYEEVTLVEIDKENRNTKQFGLSDASGKAIQAADLSGFQYELIKEDDEISKDNWILKGNGKSSTDSSAAINTFAGGYLLNYAETQTLIQRLGDLRESPNQKGAWARMYGGKYESSGNSFLSGFDMNYRGIQIGYDKKLKSNEKGDFYLGGMIGYSSGDLSYSRGKGEVDAKTLGMYGTYIKKDGFYTDFVLKYMWMENDFNVINIQGERVKGKKLDTGGIGTSIEIGKRYHKNKEEKTGWYLEPQLQLSYGTQDGGTFTASNGNKVKVDSYDSLMGRVGMMIGYEDQKKEKNIYAKVSWVKEFDGDIGVNINGTQLDESFGDSWWVYGIGFTSKINSNQSIYLDIERATGGQFREPWAIKGGWRYSF
ncbi:autotransporter outer membrane beta-barrel domain-containing protein [Selenomonadales bacterium OttesenSCG-928-I06]|nr:autotransporter outer membrane beta-barrel domain-containing protein [Selenomonadales bacterium OttesenSCG-928-I06]